MKKQILFIQGGGEGAHAVDEALAKSLRDRLGTEYDVRYPKMPEDENAGYKAWKESSDFKTTSQGRRPGNPY